MDFELDETQKLMAETAERFGKKEVIPWLEREGTLMEMIPRMR